MELWHILYNSDICRSGRAKNISRDVKISNKCSDKYDRSKVFQLSFDEKPVEVRGWPGKIFDIVQILHGVLK